MTGIDWSKAPAGTTGAMVAHFLHPKGYGTVEFLPAAGERDRFSEHAQAWVYVSRPAQWELGALPPIGTVCETLRSSTTGEYVTALILAHDENRAVYRLTSGERKGEYDSDVQHTNYGEHLPIFRPIRTAEQIAAEERLALELAACSDIDGELERFNVTLECSAAIRATINAMLAAGYRK
jgi:hypothetical protein